MNVSRYGYGDQPSYDLDPGNRECLLQKLPPIQIRRGGKWWLIFYRRLCEECGRSQSECSPAIFSRDSHISDIVSVTYKQIKSQCIVDPNLDCLIAMMPNPRKTQESIRHILQRRIEPPPKPSLSSLYCANCMVEHIMVYMIIVGRPDRMCLPV